MKLKMFAVYDQKAEAYMNPFVMQTKGQAIRAWSDTVNSDYTQLGNATNASFIGQGAGLNANYTGQGTAANTNYTGQGASDAAATMNNYNIGQNQLSALKSGVGLAANLFGGFG